MCILYLMFNLVALASGYLLLDKHLFLKSYVWRIYQRWLTERTLKWPVSAEQKSITEEISTLSCTHPTYLKIILFILIYFIYFLQYCVGFCCTTVLILFIFVFTGPSLQCMGVFLLRSTGSSGQASAAAAPRLQSTGPIVMVHGLSCSTCGIFPDQGSNLCLLHWQVDSYTTEPAGNPTSHI